jgi:hypothetical protein
MGGGYVFSDVITSTSIGTSTAQTLLNNGAQYTVSSLAGTLMAFAPEYAESGAYTAGETIAPYFTITSSSIGSIQPKNIAVAGSSGGLGATSTTMVPIVRTFDLNTRIPNSNTPLNFYGTAYVANTVAPKCGGTVWFDTLQPSSGEYEHFWDCVSATTSSGASAATVALNSLTENGGTQINKIYAQNYPGTVTASQSYVGYLTVNSADLRPQQTLRAYAQPVGVGLSTLTYPLQADQQYHPEKITMNPTATLTAQFTVEKALTGASQLAWGLNFFRGPYA